MPQKIVMHADDMVKAAEREIETLEAADAIKLRGRGDVVFVDLRDIRELARDGRVPGAFHCPRGMLEFWIDPLSKYHKDTFAQDKQFVFFCAAGARSGSRRRPPIAWGCGRSHTSRAASAPGRPRAVRSSCWRTTSQIRPKGDTATMLLILGNKNYSSWSMRPWIAMRVAGLPFDEEVISLNAPEFKGRLLQVAGTGKVPTLIDGDVRIWESLAILEYLAEKFPDAGLWPADPKARAHARVISNEMHAGFLPLRRACPMNMWRPVKKLALSDDVAANVRRIDAMWTDCRARFGASGPFLFGRFTAADAMYAPVVSRFHTYGIDVSAASHAYVEAVMGLPAWHEWRTAALKEPWVLAEDEPDWPQVLREPA